MREEGMEQNNSGTFENMTGMQDDTGDSKFKSTVSYKNFIDRTLPAYYFAYLKFENNLYPAL